MMLNRIKNKIFCGILIASTVCCSGCGVDISTKLFETPKVSGSALSASKMYSQTYLSGDVCVIPKNKVTSADKAKSITSTAAMIINDTKQTMLFSKKIYKKMYPASITKIVTAYVTLKYADLNDTVTIGNNAVNITEPGAKKCGFAKGDKIKLKELLYSFLVYSGNDAGVAIAEHVAGSVEKFADMMNQEMALLGANHSHFVNPHGLHNPKHYTTAYDLYLVFHQLIKNKTFLDIVKHPIYKATCKSASGKTKHFTFMSTNRYLVGRATPPAGITVHGGKTGTTGMAGSCLILYSKNKNGDDIVSVVLHASGGTDLYQQMSKLLSYA